MIKNRNKAVIIAGILMSLICTNGSLVHAAKEKTDVPPRTGEHDIEVITNFIGAGDPMYDVSIEVKGENEFDAKNQKQTQTATIVITNNSTNKVNLKINDLVAAGDWQPNLVSHSTNFVNMSPEAAEGSVYFGINTPACTGVSITNDCKLIYKSANKMYLHYVDYYGYTGEKQVVPTIGINQGATYSNMTTVVKGGKNLIEDKELRVNVRASGELVW